ncbi:aspartic peptidase domain-containing protein, partial [Xylariales sp. PMI_506]
SASFGYLFDAEVSFGNQTLQLLADTGSSDTWALTVGAQCFGADLNGSDPLPLSDCNYPNITYDPTASSSFSQIANETLGAHYGGGIALGIVGIEDVTVAGITVPGQTVGVVDKTSLGGDGIVNGILGLGYPALTSAHPGDSVANDTISLLTNKAVYDPILINMYKQGLLAEPWFSFALERVAAGTDKVGEGSGGFLGLGVLPPSSDIDVISDYVVAPVEITEALPLELTNGKSEITEWTLSVDSVVWSAANQSGVSSNTTKFQAVVDTGNYFNQLPQEISDAIHAAYNPPATLDEDTGAYVVSCDTDTTPASVGITIAGATFYLRPEDLVLEIADGVCVSTVLPSASDGTISLNFLGDIFLQNVVAVFDFGKNEMRFA